MSSEAIQLVVKPFQLPRTLSQWIGLFGAQKVTGSTGSWDGTSTASTAWGAWDLLASFLAPSTSSNQCLEKIRLDGPTNKVYIQRVTRYLDQWFDITFIYHFFGCFIGLLDSIPIIPSRLAAPATLGTCSEELWKSNWNRYGYGSIPINTIFRGMNIHKSQLFWCSPGVQGFDTLPLSQNDELPNDHIPSSPYESQSGASVLRSHRHTQCCFGGILHQLQQRGKSRGNSNAKFQTSSWEYVIITTV